MFWPCETRTSTCRSFATISSGLYRFLAIAVLLDVKDIPQVGPLQWGWINSHPPKRPRQCQKRVGRPESWRPCETFLFSLPKAFSANETASGRCLFRLERVQSGNVRFFWAVQQ